MNNSKLLKEMKKHRHYLHQNPEIGSYLPLTFQYITNQLQNMGYTYQKLDQSGICVNIGKTGKSCLLVRCDMDALPIEEKTELDYKSHNGNMHACGHDLHASMLLGVARLLKENNPDLNNKTIKLLFQPHEEGLVGCKKMIDAGALENPHVDEALALHVETYFDPTGTIRYRYEETTASSSIFYIHIKGKSAHGSQPHLGIDALNIATHIYISLHELIARELDAFSPNILTVGSLHSGTSHNIIPEEAVLQCSLRTFQEKDQLFILQRVKEIVDGTALLFHGQAEIKIIKNAPSVFNNKELTQFFVNCKQNKEFHFLYREHPLSVSEDFAHISQIIPSAFFTISAGSYKEGYCYTQHNSHTLFNEDVMLEGCLFLYNCIMAWLKK